MKKFLIGCLALVVVLGIGGAIGGYYFVYRPIRAYAAEFAKLKEIPELNQQVRKTAAFIPAADNGLTSDGVERFIRAQRAIQVKLGPRLDELRAKYRTFDQSQGSEHKPSFSELTGALKDLAGLIVEAKRAQVEALNQNDFSLAEYDWTRHRVYEAAGIPVDASFEKAMHDIGQGKQVEQAPTSPGPEPEATVPANNRTLVAPHVKELGERVALAFFGL